MEYSFKPMEKIVIHKRRPTAWHRDNTISPCGIRIRKNLGLNEWKELALESYFWKDVTCKKCREYLSVVKVDYLNKFTEAK